MDGQLGTGFRFVFGGMAASLDNLMSGHDAPQSVNIIKLFEKIKGRKASPAAWTSAYAPLPGGNRLLSTRFTTHSRTSPSSHPTARTLILIRRGNRRSLSI
jgi:hypothetical protein